MIHVYLISTQIIHKLEKKNKTNLEQFGELVSLLENLLTNMLCILHLNEHFRARGL